ncbi:MAG: hypothetical protein COA78_09310 [Blastopirellula sp.]|nr:MAG: hypothetical protein COA78_09310 [Blastopirellula sp.]
MISSLRLVRWFTLVILFSGFSLPFLMAGAMAAESAKLRCAFIDIEKSPLGGLLEAELIVRDDTEWLERSEIDKILAEKKLQSLFAADAGEARMSLGQILKADILIILRSETKDRKSVSQLVVSETKRGLRIVSEEFQASKDLEEDVATLVKLFEQGLEKSRQPINHIFAIPPFVSQDLTYEFDYLKSTYAQLIEQSLVSAPGVLVVEFEEARALANERRLVGDNEALKRSLPIYVLGEYRHELQGDSQQVQIKLKVMQGATELETLEETLAPNAAASFLKRSALKLAKSQGIAATIISPEAEAEQLGKRAETFMSLANWEEALGLFEAGLLIQPERMEFHGRVIEAANRLANSYNQRDLAELEKYKELNRRSIEHLHLMSEDAPLELIKPFDRLLRAPNHVYLQSNNASSTFTDKMILLEEKFQKERRDVVIRLAHRYAEQSEWRISAHLLTEAFRHLTPTKLHAERAKMILKYQDRPDVEEMTINYAHRLRAVDTLRTVEGRRFLRSLRDNPESNSGVRLAVENILSLISMKINKKEYRTQGDPENKTQLTFKSIDIEYQDLNGGTVKLKEIDGCVPLVNGLDIFYGKAIGVLLPLKTGYIQVWKPERNTRIKTVTYDGRYMWMVARDSTQAPQVWVFDPKTGERFQLSKADGLPLLSRAEIPGKQYFELTVSIAPVNSGHVIIAGSIGRTWIADVKISSLGKPEVNIFHEAKEVFTPGDWNNSNIAFVPTVMRTLSQADENGMTHKVVYIERSPRIFERPVRYPELKMHALLIDPSDLSIRIAQKEWLNRGSHKIPDKVFEGSYYYTAHTPPKNDSIGVLRVGLPDVTPEVMISGIKQGYVFFNKTGRMLNVAGREWQRGNFSERKLKSFGPVPWIYTNRYGVAGVYDLIRIEPGTIQLSYLGDSSQFGSIASCSIDGGSSGVVQVLFDGSGATLARAITGTQELTAEQSPRVVVTPRTSLPRAINFWQDQAQCSSLAYSPDGSYFITTNESTEQSVQAWDTQSGQLIANLLDDSKGITKVAFSPSGEFFATGGTDGKIIVWDAKQLQPITRCEGLSAKIECLAFSWNSNKLVAAISGRNAKISAWNVSDGKQLFEINYQVGIRGWVCFSRDDTQVITSIQNASAMSGWGAQAWSAEDGTRMDGIESMKIIAGFLDDKSMIGVPNNGENTLLKWDSTDGEFKELWPRMQGIPVAVSSDGKYLVTFVRNQIVQNKWKDVNRILVWDLNTKQQVLSQDDLLAEEFHWVKALNELVILSNDGSVKRLSLEPKVPFPAIEPSKSD